MIALYSKSNFSALKLMTILREESLFLVEEVMNVLYLSFLKRFSKYAGLLFLAADSLTLIKGVFWLLSAIPRKSSWYIAAYSGFAEFTSMVIRLSLDSITPISGIMLLLVQLNTINSNPNTYKILNLFFINSSLLKYILLIF